MRKSLIASLAVAASLLAAGAAQASNVHWSIGINLPPVGTVISNAPVYAPVYAPAPVYYPAPVYAPAPVYVPAPPVVYGPPRVIYRPAPVVYRAPAYVARPVPIVYPGWGDRDHDGVANRYDRYDNRRHWDRDHDGVPNHRDRHDDRKHRH